MSDIFMLIALVLLGAAALLRFAPHLRVLNFVNYDVAQPTRINRYAAARLLLPVGVSAASSYVAAVRPELALPLMFAPIVAILVAVVWIAAGVTRLRH